MRYAIGYMAGSADGYRRSLHHARSRRPDHFGARKPKNGDVTVTRARLKDDGTVVEILRDGSERPLAPEVDWFRIDATTKEQVAA